VKVLITGGTGSLGQALIDLLLGVPKVKRIRSLSRGEHKITEAKEKYADQRIDWFVGDVREYERVNRAAEDCEIVLHCSAFKSIDLAEHDPWDAVQTNIIGTHNVARACIQQRVGRCVLASTDKAVNPYNFYGTTKRAAEGLWIQSNVGKHNSKFMCARFGNQFNSNGSVVQRWLALLAKHTRTGPEIKGPVVHITDPNMTRFFLPISEAALFVYQSALAGHGGEIYIPKMRSISLRGLAGAVFEGKAALFRQVGIRPGEKIHEVLISKDEVWLTRDGGNCYIRYPSHALFPVKKMGDPLPKEFEEFNSFNAPRLTKDEIQSWLKQTERVNNERVKVQEQQVN
jgi:FlaA1/EpsC-like NDP-sugar epimerase